MPDSLSDLRCGHRVTLGLTFCISQLKPAKQVLRKLNTETCDPDYALLGTQPKGRGQRSIKQPVHVCTHLCSTVHSNQEPKGPSKAVWINSTGCITGWHNKRRELWHNATMWVNLEDFLLSEINQL